MPARTQLDTLAATVERAFERIAGERMRGLPIVNPRLRVQLCGLRAWKQLALGVLVTPWCMNLLALPGAQQPDRERAGSRRTLQLPSGSYELVCADTPGVGPHLSGSLFSPMQDFATQQQAVEAAHAALELLLRAPDGTPAATAKSRRDFLLGPTGAAR